MRRDSAFTLVELLIVLTILGLLLGLVGPLAVDRFEKAQAQEEWLTLERTVSSLAFRAYAEGRSVELRGQGGRLTWQSRDGEPRQLEFRHLFFDPPQHVVVNPNGVSDPGALALRQSGRERSIALNAWLEGSP